MSTIGAFAEVQWLDEDCGDFATALFIIGNDMSEINENEEQIDNWFNQNNELQSIYVIEVTDTDWDIARRGQNIGRGWKITSPSTIALIKTEEHQ